MRIKAESERKLTIDLDDALEQVAFHVTEIEDLQAKVNDAARAKDEELKEVRMANRKGDKIAKITICTHPILTLLFARHSSRGTLTP